MASIGFIKERNPMIYAKWVMSYVLVLQLVLTPKTDVAIYDIAAQKDRVISNVPVIFAATASLITSVGVGLAESYDALLKTLRHRIDFAQQQIARIEPNVGQKLAQKLTLIQYVARIEKQLAGSLGV